MRYRTTDDVKDGFGSRTGSCRKYTSPRAHPDSPVKLWIKRDTEIGPVLEVKTFCHLDVHGIEIQIPSTSRDNYNARWSFPVVQTVTWKSYDTMIQIILQEALKKLIMEAFRKLMQNSRLFNRDLSVVYPKTIFLFAKGNG